MMNETINRYIGQNFSISGSVDMETHTPFRPEHGLVFILILSGKAVVKTNNKEYSARRGMLISIVPLQSYTITEPSGEFSYEYIAFNLDFMADFPLLLKPHTADKMDMFPCLSLDKENFKLIKEYYRNTMQLYEKYEDDGYLLRIDMLKASLYIIIAEVTFLYSKQVINVKSTRQEQIADDFLGLLHNFYRKERKPEFYADKLNISPRHLTKIVKKVTGQTPWFWICEFVIRESKIMLQSTDKNISQISDELNFPNSSYFARYFRNYTGLAPVEFREKPKEINKGDI